MNIVKGLPFVNWSNGIVMMGIFVLVCLALIALLVSFMRSGNNE